MARQYLTIGWIRSDGDLDVCFTLNNDNLNLPDAQFEALATYLASLVDDAVILEREDAPSTVTISEEDPSC